MCYRIDHLFGKSLPWKPKVRGYDPRAVHFVAVVSKEKIVSSAIQ